MVSRLIEITWPLGVVAVCALDPHKNTQIQKLLHKSISPIHKVNHSFCAHPPLREVICVLYQLGCSVAPTLLSAPSRGWIDIERALHSRNLALKFPYPNIPSPFSRETHKSRTIKITWATVSEHSDLILMAEVVGGGFRDNNDEGYLYGAWM